MDEIPPNDVAAKIALAKAVRVAIEGSMATFVQMVSIMIATGMVPPGAPNPMATALMNTWYRGTVRARQIGNHGLPWKVVSVRKLVDT